MEHDHVVPVRNLTVMDSRAAPLLELADRVLAFVIIVVIIVAALLVVVDVVETATVAATEK